jgi:hypothetical protein
VDWRRARRAARASAIDARGQVIVAKTGTPLRLENEKGMALTDLDSAS